MISSDLGTQWLANLGVEVHWQQLEWGSYLDRLHQRLPNVWLAGWVADYPDADSFLRQAILDRSGGSWTDKRYMELVDRARQSPSLEDRVKLFEAAQRLLAEQVPLLPLLYNRGEYLLKPWVVEYPLSPMRWDFFKDVVIEPHD